MAKVDLTTITTGFASTDALNTNFDTIESGFDNTLSRDGTTPNSMSADIDMNSNRVLNIVAPTSNNEPVRLSDLALTSYTDTTLPSQTGHAGDVLGTNGTSQLWVTPDVSPITVADKAAAQAITPTAGASLIILSDDGAGRAFKALVGAASGTYSDNGGSYCGTQFIPTGGDGTTAWRADNHNSGIGVAIEFGLKGDGTTDDSVAAEAATSALSSSGGGVLRLHPGTYRVQNLKAKNNILVRGASFGAVILKVVDGVDKQVFYNENADVPITVDFFGLENLILDGNKSNAEGVTAASACAINGVTYFYSRNCIYQNASGYGLAFQAYPTSSSTGEQSKIYLENVYLLNNGSSFSPYTDTFDGLDIKDCHTITLNHVYAKNNSDRGINIRGDNVNLFACFAEGNGKDINTSVPAAGIEIVGNSNNSVVSTTCRLISCESRSNGGAGFTFANGSGTATELVRIIMSACMSFSNDGDGVSINGTSDKVECIISDINAAGNGRHGVSFNNTVIRSAAIRGGILSANGLSGVHTNFSKARISDVACFNNARYGIEEGANGTRTIVGGASSIIGNSLGEYLFNANKRYHIGSSVVDYNIGSADVIPSAATITLPEGGEVIFITGTVDITSIAASRRGRKVTLVFSDVLTITDGSNLSLAGDFITSSADTLSLVFDGTNWIESGRSIT